MKKIVALILLQLSCNVVSAQVPVVPGPTTTTTRYIDNKGTITNLTFTKTTIGYVFASGHIQPHNNPTKVLLYGLNATVTNDATGKYTVSFGVAHPSGDDYPITLGVQEDSRNNRRDGRIIQVVTGTQSASGFEIMILTGDNGTTADPFVDDNWYFSVPATISVVTDVELTTN